MAAAAQQLAAEAQRRRRRQLDQCLPETHRAAHRADQWRSTHQETTTRREQLEDAHPELIDLNGRQVVGYLLLVLMLGALYLVDLLVFSPTAEYLARTFLSGHPWLQTVARFLIPLCILLIELGLASKLYFAREEAARAGSRGASYWFWFLLALLFALVMPTLVIATQMAAHVETVSERMEIIYGWQMVALVILTFVTHLLVIFGGRPSHDAKTYLLYRHRHRSLSRAIRQQDAGFEREAQNATLSFSTYLRTLNAYNDATPQARVTPGPFDAVTRHLINERYGYEVIQSPSVNNPGNGAAGVNPNGGAPASPTGASARQPNPSPSPRPAQTGSPSSTTPTPPAGASMPTASAQAADDAQGDAAMEEYYRTVLTQQVRNQDSEVQV